jgi:2'-5' RNA ligase
MALNNQISRFAVYLVPPYPIARDIAEIHRMLRKQFGFSAAGRFQVHCTIKGFFKKNERPLETLIEELDIFFGRQIPFEVEISGLRNSEFNIVLELDNLRGSFNQKLLLFRENVVEITRPYIASDCDFIEHDLGKPYRGHITLAFRDNPKDLRGQVISWIQEASMPMGAFTANTFQLLEFFSDQWDGPWWETLSWKLHRSWRLNLD